MKRQPGDSVRTGKPGRAKVDSLKLKKK